MPADKTILPAHSNQALGIANYAIEFMKSGDPSDAVKKRTDQFNTDACLCGISALALGTNAPTVLRNEALHYPVPPAGYGTFGALGKAKNPGATVFGSTNSLKVEKAICANSSAVREWDSNGTNFGYNPELGHTAGEFGHNDFYAVPIAAAQMMGKGGDFALKGMILHDEIRGRLAEVFSLKTYKIDHVLHGGIASAATFGAMVGATPEQIESAIGMIVAHHVPFRAIRAGKQLSDSKGASAAINTEAAIVAMKRSMAGFLGPRDIFRNPEAVFRIFEGPGQMFKAVNADGANTAQADASPFDLHLANSGDDFAVMGMHFKLGLYEHQSAGAIMALIDLVAKRPELLDQTAKPGDRINTIKIVAYEPAYGIIGDPAKRDPRTRQSADHSMVYIIGTLLRKAIALRAAHFPSFSQPAELWKATMLSPYDYSEGAIFDSVTRDLMGKIVFEHGGDEYDRRYPDGIPTSMVITDADGQSHDSGMVMYPIGHARHTTHSLDDMLAAKFAMLGALAAEDPGAIVKRYENIGAKSPKQIAEINDFQLKLTGDFE